MHSIWLTSKCSSYGAEVGSEKVCVSHKRWTFRDENKVTRNDLSKESLLWEIDQSLERLQTDYIDIYQLHWPDPNVPLKETAEALKEMLDAGKN